MVSSPPWDIPSNGQRKDSSVRAGLVLLVAWIIVTGICPAAFSQTGWQQRKDKDGIKVFTKKRLEPGVISYKWIATVDVDPNRLLRFLADVDRFPEWKDGCSRSRLIREEEGGGYLYYVVYDFPFPFRDRYMVVDVSVREEDEGSVTTVESRSADEMEEEGGGMTRITNFWETSRLIRRSETSVEIHTEGFFDPGGNIPAWLTNMHVDNSPIRTVRNLRETLE